MFSRYGTRLRWLALLTSGTILLQAPTCIDYVQTGLLGVLTATTALLVRNV